MDQREAQAMNNTLHSDRYWRQRAGYIQQEKAMNKADEEAKQWIAETTAEMTTFVRREVVDALNVYYINQQGEATCKRGKEAAGQLIRQWLETNGETEIEDIERGLKAILASRRSGKDSYDVRSMTQAQVVKLWKAGCLVVDTEALNLKANAALRMEAEPQKIPAGSTTYLRVVKDE